MIQSGLYFVITLWWYGITVIKILRFMVYGARSFGVKVKKYFKPLLKELHYILMTPTL